MGNKARALNESEQQDASMIVSNTSISSVLKEVAEKFYEPNILISDEQSLVNRIEQWKRQELLSKKLTSSAITYELYHLRTYIDLYSELEEYIKITKKIIDETKMRKEMVKIIRNNWDMSGSFERKKYRAAKRIGDLLTITNFGVLVKAGLQASDLYQTAHYYNIFYKELTGRDCDEIGVKELNSCKYKYHNIFLLSNVFILSLL